MTLSVLSGLGNCYPVDRSSGLRTKGLVFREALAKACRAAGGEDMEFLLFVALLAGVGWLVELAFKATLRSSRNKVGRYKHRNAIQIGAKDQQWVSIELPNHRPTGRWVNWTFGSGWVKVKGTSQYQQNILQFMGELEKRNPIQSSFAVELRREPSNRHDANAVQVYALLGAPEETAFLLGYVDAEAAAWLSASFAPEMPISAEIVRFRTNHSFFNIEVCGLMPAKNARREFEL